MLWKHWHDDRKHFTCDIVSILVIDIKLVRNTHFVRTDNNAHIIYFCLVPNLCSHLIHPAIESLKTVSVRHIIYQHGTLCVSVKLIPHLKCNTPMT